MGTAREETREETGEETGEDAGEGVLRRLGPLVALGIVFLLSLTGLLRVGSAGRAAADAPYQDGPLAAGASGSGLAWEALLSPNADEIFALICLMALLIGFRWAGLSQRDRISR